MKKTLIVGGSLRDAAARVKDVVHRAEAGEDVPAQDTVTFSNWAALAAVMTERRFELLKHLHQAPAPSIRALARDLDRDFKRVHEDVTALEAAGLIDRDGRTLRADYSEIQASISLDTDAA